MAGPNPFPFNPNDPQNGGQPPDPGMNPFLANAAQGDPFAGFPGPPPMPDGNPGLSFPDEAAYDPDSDPVAQRLQGQDPVDLNLDLGAERETRLAQFLCQQIDAWKAIARRRVENLSGQWRPIAYELLPPGTANRWQNSSDIPSPLTRIAANAHITRLVEQLNNSNPPLTAKARKPEARDACPLIEDCMDAVLDQADWPTVCEDMVRELVIAGQVFMRTTYEQETTRVPKRLVDHDPETAASLFQATGDLHESLWHSVQRVKFGHEEETIYDGVRWRVIPFEDGVLWPVTCRNPDEAKGIGERRRLSGEELLAGVRSKAYREDAVNELLEHGSDAEPQERVWRKDEQGLMPDYGAVSYDGKEQRLFKEYEVYELCVRYDADEDDQLEWIVVHLHKDSRQILGLRWLDYEHGRPYYSMPRYIRRTNELLGMGIPELVAAYQDGDTAVWNQIVDHNDLSLNIGGNFAFTGLSGYNPEETILQLGRPLKFENLAETEFKQLAPYPLPTEAYQLNGRFKDVTDLLTATSNPTLGAPTQGSKTLGEIQIVASASNQIFQYFAAGVAREVGKLWDQARWLTAQFGLRQEDGGIRYRRSAAPDQVEFASIQPEQLAADVDIVPTGLVMLSDMQARITQATLVHTQLMNLIATMPQWIHSASAVFLSFGQYLKSLNYPLREKMMAALEQSVAAFMGMQQQAMALQAAGAAGMGQPPGGGAGAPAPPPGSLGGAPAPIPGPPPLPPGATSTHVAPNLSAAQ